MLLFRQPCFQFSLQATRPLKDYPRNSVTTEKMAIAQPSSSKLFCFTGLLITLGNSLFEEEESINYFEVKCVCYGFNRYYQIRFEAILDALQYPSFSLGVNVRRINRLSSSIIKFVF